MTSIFLKIETLKTSSCDLYPTTSVFTGFYERRLWLLHRRFVERESEKGRVYYFLVKSGTDPAAYREAGIPNFTFHDLRHHADSPIMPTHYGPRREALGLYLRREYLDRTLYSGQDLR